ncbi:biogenesis of lysosome-related organelles complex 1 subunit 3 [Diorhabda carinulata]|uniref:biogenesis of lysosome-related organelles complex 1 subunit 3 n=1 Tax=Diorhabda carinulata TaxID=1163345 RepID=UPI0025A010FE|nr:biogenesis of lysosome-related organelles complex 1 subunit 3 [Diorhabda carinulata]
MNKPLVISGEASETDSEDESPTVKVNNLTNSVQGAVITGEDSESDNDTYSSVVPKGEVKYDSLFHQKLREQNEKLKVSFENICQSPVNEAGKTLNLIDQNLIRSQITLQIAVTSLKTLSINSLTIKSKLHSLLSSNFLSNVILNDK